MFSFSKIDPRSKLFFTIIVTILALFFYNIFLSSLLLITTILICILSRERYNWIFYLSPFKVLIPLLLVLNTLFYTSGDVIWQHSFLKITTGGINTAVLILLRLVTIASVAALFAVSTDPEKFEVALVKLHVPWKFSFILSLTLKLVPEMKRRFRKIEEAQISRGLAIKGGPIQKSKARIPMILPFMSSIIRYGYDLAEALKARNFDSTTKRTYFLQLKYKGFDYLWYLFSLLFLGFFIIIKIFLT